MLETQAKGTIYCSDEYFEEQHRANTLKDGYVYKTPNVGVTLDKGQYATNPAKLTVQDTSVDLVKTMFINEEHRGRVFAYSALLEEGADTVKNTGVPMTVLAEPGSIAVYTLNTDESGGGVLRTNDPVQSFDCTNKKYVDANTWYKHKVVLTLLLNLTPPWNPSTVQQQGIVIKGYYFSKSKERLTYDGSNYESLQLAYLNLLGKDFTTTYAYVGHYDPTSSAIVKDNVEGCIYGLFIGENDQYDANPSDPNSIHLGEHTFEINIKCDQWDVISETRGTGLVTGRFKLFDINTGRLTALYDSVVE